MSPLSTRATTMKRSSPAMKSRRNRRGTAQKLYLEALEARQLLSGAPAVQTYYVPFPATTVLTALQTIHKDPEAPISTYTSIAVAEDGTQIYYNQWETGYVSDITNPTPAQTYNAITNPGGVQIWGDGDPSNGAAPGFPSDVLQAGDVILLSSPSIAVPRDPSQIYFDGGDKIATTKSVAIGVLNYASVTATKLAGALQVDPTSNWGTSYQVPIGQNTANAGVMFAYTGIEIMAQQDGTTVDIDTNGDGKTDKVITLNQGQDYLVNNGVKKGATVVSTDPSKSIQVDLITGSPSETYASRWFNLAPIDQWSNSYYTPVSTSSTHATNVFLYNPGTTAITVTQTTRGNGGAAATLTTTSVSVPANGSVRVTIAAGSGAHFMTPAGQPFYAVTTIDFNGSNYDWGMALIPQNQLTTQAIVGLGFGRDPTSLVNPTENGSPVWVTPVGNGNTVTTVYVDFNGDNSGPLTDPNGYHYDETLSLKELQAAEIFDPDGNQSGMFVYTLDPNVKLAVSWGEDPSVASASFPGVDAGTNIVPLPEFDAGKSASLLVDANGDGVVSPGDTLLYTIVVNNISRTTLIGLDLTDSLPSNLTYIPGTTSYTLTPHDGTAGAATALADAGATAFPLDESGDTLPMLMGGATYTLTFQAKIADVLATGVGDIINTGAVTAPLLNETVPLKSDTPVDFDLRGLVFKDSNRDGVQEAGEPGLAGVTVHLLNGTTSVATATTDANGNYTFVEGLGTYTVTVDEAGVDILVPQAVQTAGTNPSNVLVNGGGALVDAGIDGYMTPVSAIPSSLAGRVTVDGVGVPNVLITLTGTNAQGPLTLTTTTGTDGTYLFPAVLNGTYTLTETQPVGLLDGPDFAGTFGGTPAAVPGDQISGIVIPGASNGVDYDFTEIRPASITSVVFNDGNNNGIQDPGELGIAGAQITVTLNADDGEHGTIIFNTGTDGSFTLGKLRPGTYTITETQPAAYLDGTDSLNGTVIPGSATTDAFTNLTVAEGASVNVTFGELAPATTSGTVYVDANNNGTKDAGEPGIGGVQLTISGTNDRGTITPTTVTSGTDGTYSFDNLRPGTYTITETQPAGDLDGKDAKNGIVIAGSNTTDVITGLTTTSGSTAGNNTFGELQPGTTSGTVYLDTNDNGIKDAGETGIGGVQLTLTGTNDLGAIAPIMITTAADGTYSFGNLRPGTYAITEAQPAGDLDGLDAKNGVVITGSNTTDTITGLTTTSGSTAGNNLFGELQPGTASGFVYNDANNNGVKDSGETGIAGVVLTLTGTNDLGAILPVTTTTAADGSYSFGTLRPGTYTITETQPAGYMDGLDAKNGVVIAGSNTTDAITGITSTSGSTAPNNLFGEMLGSSVSGNVYVDANDNGTKDVGETGIGGVQLTLTGTNDLGPIMPITITSGTSGSYSFGGLRPGTYTVTESQPAGYLDGLDAKNGVVITGSNATDVISGVTNGSNNDNFGELLAGTASGSVYADGNNNGIKDSGETGIGGVQLTISGSNDLGAITPVTVTTAGDGSYSFGNLRPGTYIVTETQPAGYIDGLDAKNGVVIANSNTTDAIAGITTTSGSTAANNTFGELPAGNISGLVFVDGNDNGIKDAGETAIGGVSVTLSGSNDLGPIAPIGITTATDGSFTFTGLRPGTYSITETQPAGYLDGLDAKAGAVITASNTTDAISGITLGAANATGNTFGELLAGTASGTVFLDSNNNGTKDTGETGIAGVQITLTGTSDLGTITPVTLTTAADGTYSFGNLRPGTYTITEAQPAGDLDGLDAKNGVVIANSNTTDAITGITTTSGSTAGSNTFGELQAGTLSGFVYNDANNNGTKDTGEAGISGAKVTLTGTNDLGAITAIAATTAADGSYSFANLRPGTYTITETQPAGFTEGKDSLGTLGGTLGNDVISAITVSSAAIGTGYNFGEAVINNDSISGKVFRDLTGDGQTADDVALPGVTVNLYRDDGDHVRDAGDVLVATTTSAATTGAFSFTGLPKGYYFTEEVVPTGYVRTGPTTVGYWANDLTGTTTTATGDNFDNYQLCNCKTDVTCLSYVINGCTTVSTLAGNVHQGDTVKVNFTISMGKTLTFVTYTAPDPTFVADHSMQQVIFDTDSKTFTAGTHSLTVVVPNCYFQIDFVCGTALSVLGPAGSNIYYTPENRLIDSDNGGTTPPTPLATSSGTASIAGSVYVDSNKNGVRNTGEAGISGVRIILTGVTTTGQNVEIVVITDASGNFKFSNLVAGTYKISEGSFDGHTDGKDTAGTRGGSVTNDVISNIGLPTGNVATGYLFGEN